MLQHGAVAVVEPFSGQGQTEVPTIVGTGIPYVNVNSASTAELASPSCLRQEGGFPAALGEMALNAKQHRTSPPGPVGRLRGPDGVPAQKVPLNWSLRSDSNRRPAHYEVGGQFPTPSQ